MKIVECNSTQHYRWRSWTMVGKLSRGVGQCRCRATNPLSAVYGYRTYIPLNRIMLPGMILVRSCDRIVHS